MSKSRLGHDPFKEEEPLSFIGDTRGKPARGHNTKGFIIGPETVKRGNIGNMDNTINNHESIFKPGPKSRRGRPRGTGTKAPENWKRATFIMRKDALEKLRALAYWERLTVTELLDLALAAYLKGKKIKPIGSK